MEYFEEKGILPGEGYLQYLRRTSNIKTYRSQCLNEDFDSVYKELTSQKAFDRIIIL